MWQFAIIWGISLWLATVGLLTALSTSDAYGDVGYDPRLRSMDDYLAGDILQDSLLGLTLREDRRELKSGATATGLLIVAIGEGSPAAKAGLAAIRKAPRGILSALIVVGSLAFPPAIMLLPVANSLPIELGGDLIIAADGSLVRNYLDYQNEIRNAQPGEIVYRGVRKQVPVPLPAIVNY